MPETTLHELLERNARHAGSLPKDYFSAVESEQRPAAVSICCSDSRVPQEGMFDVDEPGWLFTPSTIGNQVWDVYDGERVIDGSILYPMVNTETKVTLVVGHTGCGAVTAALSAVEGTEDDAKSSVPPGIEKWVGLLAPVIEDGLADERVDADRDVGLVDQLVEYNVDRQVEFLLDSEDVPDDETVFGFVYDFQGVYGDDRGRTCLVNADGETDVESLRDRVPDEFSAHIKRLL